MDNIEIPKWAGMAESVSMGSLSWEDVFFKVAEKSDRTPTREETTEMFDMMSRLMKNAVQDVMPDLMNDLIYDVIDSINKPKEDKQ